jgi:hypothetical protein
MWTGLILLRTGTDGGVAELLASEEGQCSMVVDRILLSPQRISHRRKEPRWRIMMGIFGLKINGENYFVREFTFSILHLVSFGLLHGES